MDFSNNERSCNTLDLRNATEVPSKPSEIARKNVNEARQQGRANEITNRRFGPDFTQQTEDKDESLTEILTKLNSSKFSDKLLLIKLKSKLGSGHESPEEFFASGCGDQNLHNLVNIMSTSGHEYQLIAIEILANLSPLSERSGLKFARAAGPYLITLLSSHSSSLKEASSIALGNLALAGFKVVKVLLHQDVVDRLCHNLPEPISNDEDARSGSTSYALRENLPSPKVTSATLYALYHIIHTLDNPRHSTPGNSTSLVSGDSFVELLKRCFTLLHGMKTKAPLELFWVLFALSCRCDTHSVLTEESVIHALLDICTYEIYQKSDPRPLVKVVTPICRMLANLCAGSNDGEAACLFVLRHPDVTALLMALLGTNYTHLCKETLWLFANIINSESVLVQEEIVELNMMDKLEYHTTAVIQKIDPYAVQ